MANTNEIVTGIRNAVISESFVRVSSAAEAGVNWETIATALQAKQNEQDIGRLSISCREDGIFLSLDDTPTDHFPDTAACSNGM